MFITGIFTKIINGRPLLMGLKGNKRETYHYQL